MNRLDASTRASLAKLLRLMLSTNRDGEVLASVSAIKRILVTAGLDLHDLAREIERPVAAISAPPPWQIMVDVCDRHRRRLSAKERGLVETLQRWHGQPTDKQLNWLSAIFERVAA